MAYRLQFPGSMQFLRELNSFSFHHLRGGKILKAVDGAGELSVIVEERRDIDEDGNSRAIRPLDHDFHVSRRRACSKNSLHRRLTMREWHSVRTEQLMGA